jgi:hypothetical protein
VQESLVEQAVEESPKIKWPSAKRNSVSETFGGHLDRCWRDAVDGSGNVLGYATRLMYLNISPFSVLVAMLGPGAFTSGIRIYRHLSR